ncbi:winged helix DNA-binding domain-containing protein [Cohnella terricola]|uniref:Winged helix DNA-binding domain-containing protein n=1 Tax=Cohnella terricola TaxID=1289167 RepID=A0A559JAJ2_9BACL|nr:winged helix DNA-binding domain-containing protein [Cohnella terricola]TVX96867.1 winged helix DNA-binding domain-containing protein [Cohnella terricola]
MADNGATLSRRALNRALLERQMLIKRTKIPALDVMEHLIGLQAQAPNPPYIGLWARVEDFRQDELSGLIESRQAVRIALMRSTIHLTSARDALSLRPVVQPALERGLKGNYGKHLAGIDEADLAAEARTLVEKRPMTFRELGGLLAEDERWRNREPDTLAAAVRTLLPLVQIPPRGLWGESGQSVHTTAEAWLGSPAIPAISPETMIERYLAAFGPASAKDMQTWSGLTRLGEVVKRIRPRLRIYYDEQGRELFDVLDAPLPDPDMPIPPRYMAEFDNALLSHADRSRIISEEDRKRVFTINGIIRPTFLIDGFVAGMWRIDRKRDAAILTIEPFRPLRPEDRAGLYEEGDNLLRFAAAECGSREIRIADESTSSDGLR